MKYQWMIVTQKNECYTAASQRGIDIFDSIGDSSIRDLIFFATGLPSISIKCESGRRLIWAERWEKAFEEGNIVDKWEVIGFEQNGIKTLTRVNLETGLVEIASING